MPFIPDPDFDRTIIQKIVATLDEANNRAAMGARLDCPVRTGALRASIDVEVARIEGRKIVGSITADRPYAYEVEMLDAPFLGGQQSTIEQYIAQNL